jgi:hypothetical protein
MGRIRAICESRGFPVPRSLSPHRNATNGNLGNLVAVTY